MKQLRTAGLVLVAVLAVAAASASAASAHTFEYSQTGELKGKQVGNQVFKFPVGTITCTEDSLKGNFNSLEFHRMPLALEYKGCTSSLGTVTSSAAEVEFLAYESGAAPEVKLTKELAFKITTVGLTCTVSVPAQGPFKTVEYVNVIEGAKSTIEARVAASKLRSSDSGAVCTKKYTNDETGELTAKNKIELVGGSLNYR